MHWRDHGCVAADRNTPEQRETPCDKVHSTTILRVDAQIEVSEHRLRDDTRSRFPKHSLPGTLQWLSPPLTPSRAGAAREVVTMGVQLAVAAPRWALPGAHRERQTKSPA